LESPVYDASDVFKNGNVNLAGYARN